MKQAYCYLMVLLAFVALLPCQGLAAGSCTPSEKKACYCPDGTQKQQACKADGKSWDTCNCTATYTAWCDDTSGLCWQDPQKDANNTEDSGIMPGDGVRYCKRLAMGGYTDWRLPTIDELRTLVRGNPATEADGECPLVEGSVSTDMNDPTCGPVTSYGGPGAGTAQGCYWPPELTGTCNRPDPFSKGHPLEYASSTRCPDAPTKNWYGVVMFDNGAVTWNHINTSTDVRCVRSAPTAIKNCVQKAKCLPGETQKCITGNLRAGAQVCAPEGNCWGPCENTTFTESPPAKDVCPTCDQINLTVRVPEKLAVKPIQLMAFLYAADTWTFPPNRPPDGGNSDCQVTDPEIDVDKPFKLTVPACTYYRRQCLRGLYKLYVAIMQTETMPPTMLEGDYWWGIDQEPLELGKAETFNVDITLEAWHAE